jgi:hypothetical protein
MTAPRNLGKETKVGKERKIVKLRALVPDSEPGPIVTIVCVREGRPILRDFNRGCAALGADKFAQPARPEHGPRDPFPPQPATETEPAAAELRRAAEIARREL